jgi:hypothetical protein
VRGVHQVLDDREWKRLIEQLRSGDCTPFLGAGAAAGTLPTAADLSQRWAADYEYPFQNRADLADVMQYASIIERDPVTVKQHVKEFLANRKAPDFRDPAEPHALLARFPVRVYLTTNYDDFMKQALLRERKDPTTAVCPWYRGANDDAGTRIPRDYRPRADKPLVYHLHGSFRHPSSLVLTEQDYAEFLVTLVKEQGTNEHRVIPTQVLNALTRLPLLFIGYSLRDASFRTLFHGLVKSVAEVQRRRHVSVQLPLSSSLGPDAAERATQYLNRYFNELNISVYWGTAQQFCSELNDRLESA